MKAVIVIVSVIALLSFGARAINVGTENISHGTSKIEKILNEAK